MNKNSIKIGEFVKDAITEIEHLNPKPGGTYAGNNRIVEHVVPDFAIKIVDGELELTLNGRNAPELHVSREYSNMMNSIRDRIIATYGVPPAKVSIIETANLGSGSGLTQDKQFKKELKGKSKNFEDAFTRVISHGEFSEVFQYNDLDIEDKLQRAQIEDIQIKNGSLTINEVRNSYLMKWEYRSESVSHFGSI